MRVLSQVRAFVEAVKAAVSGAYLKWILGIGATLVTSKIIHDYNRNYQPDRMRAWLEKNTPAEARIRPRSARRVCETGERHMGRPAFTWRRRCTSLGPLCHAPRLRRCSSREAALFVAAQPPPSSETRVRRARAAHHTMHVPAVATRSGASHALLDDGARRASALRLAPRRRTAVLSTATGRFAGAAW